ncbi:endonuclease/exonuclease/phosphatase family protein [Streptomyces sp. x-80]|uniref:endonuclease/exonuclease/phosphatase family protein n=1 Tax=Streptomyces sp. x-80 TaxID=2789282 RepID=UPI00398140D8
MARFVTWNVWTGGIDPDGSEKRRHDQIEVLAQLDPQPTILAIQEARGWHQEKYRRLHELATALGMVAWHPVTSHIGDGTNHTALLYRPGAVTVLGYTPGANVGSFHHGLAVAHVVIDGTEMTLLTTHLSYVDGDARLREARCLTDYAGPFPGLPGNSILLADLNTGRLDDPVPHWDTDVPANMHARYREVRDDGQFGGPDNRAMTVLLQAGWKDPQDQLGTPRTATVGYKYANEPTPLHLDHILTAGSTIRPHSYLTHDTPLARAASDHLPVVLDTH